MKPDAAAASIKNGVRKKMINIHQDGQQEYEVHLLPPCPKKEIGNA